MASPLDTATTIVRRKKQLLGEVGAPGGPATPAPVTPPGFKFTPMATSAAQTLGQATAPSNTPPTTPPGFKFTPMTTPAAQALGAATMSVNSTSTTPPGFKFTPEVTPAAQALGQATMGSDNRVVSATAAPATTPAASNPANAPAATRQPRSTAAESDSAGFDYSGMTRSSGEMQDEARARAAMQIDLRAQALTEGLARARAAAEDQRKGQMTNLAGMEEGNRYRYAGSNLGTSGFMAGANAVAQGATQDNIGQINQSEQQMIEATNNQLAELERLRGSVTTATLADLERMNNDVQFKGADLASVLANRKFELERGKSLLGGELTAQELANQGMDLGNQGAALGLERGRGLLPYELGNAAVGYQRNSGLLPYDLGNAATDYRRNSLMLPLDVQKAQLGVAGDALQLDTASKMQPYTLEGARLGNERAAQVNRMAELDYILANDPDVGKRAQAQVEMQQARKQLELTDAQIKQATAKALTGGSSGSGGSFTAWQQYQMIRDEKGDGDKVVASKEKARDKLVDSFRSDYTVSQAGAEMWADFMELAMEPSPDGAMLSRGELGELLAQMLNNPGVPANDKGWAQSMFWAGQGEQWAQNELNGSKYRKKPVTPDNGTKPPQD